MLTVHNLNVFIGGEVLDSQTPDRVLLGFLTDRVALLTGEQILKDLGRHHILGAAEFSHEALDPEMLTAASHIVGVLCPR